LVQVLSSNINKGNGKDGDGGAEYQKKSKKVKGAKVSQVSQAVNELLESYKDGINREEWEGIVDKIGIMFIGPISKS
jgi:hypothetical protein